MAFQWTINGVDYTTRVQFETVVVVEARQIRGSTMTLVIQIQNADIAVPACGNEIIFTRDGIKEFAGRVGACTEIQTGADVTYLAYELECIDYSVDLDMELVNRGADNPFPSQIAGDTVRNIVGAVGRGFTSINVDDGPVIGELDAEFAQPTSLISAMSESIEFQWYVDYDRDVHFYFLRDEAAPIASIDVENDVDTYWDLSVTEDWEQVKNRIYLTGAKVKSTNQDTIQFIGDGGQTFFPLNYEPWDQPTMDVELDTIDQTKLFDIIDGEAGDGGGSAGEVYICFDNWGCRFPDNNPPANLSVIDIVYNYAFEPVVVVEDPASIAAMKLLENTPTAPSNGVHELHFQIPELRADDINTINDYGQLLLLRYASIVKAVSFTSDIQGWKAGQNLEVLSTARAINQIVFVTRVTKTIQSIMDTTMEYAIEAQSSPFLG